MPSARSQGPDGGGRRVIHIVENLDRGAVETWLVRMLEHAQRRGQALDWTFYCTLPRAGAMDERARASGATVIHADVPIAQKALFLQGLRRTLTAGPYDVMHCHHDIMSAAYLIAARGLPIARKLVHVHNADENVPTSSRVKQMLTREPMRQMCLQMADRIVGISNHTLDTFVRHRRRPGRDVVLYYGVDAGPVATGLREAGTLRQEFGVPVNARVLLFGGRVTPEKNPEFVIDILAALKRLEPRAVAVFAGAGSLEEATAARARALGVETSVYMLGWRSDLRRIMPLGDWFVLPRPESPKEGFGLAVVEAQLAGLRLLVSLGIPQDAFLPSAVFRQPGLHEGPEVWAKAALDMLSQPAPSRDAARADLKASAMDMDTALGNLIALHQ